MRLAARRRAPPRLPGALGARREARSCSATRTGAAAASATARGPSIVVELRRPDAFWRKLGTRTRVGFGESYVDGDWDCDDLVGLFSLLGRNLEATADHPALKRLYRLQELRPDRRPRQTLAAAKDNIHAHYDLGNELFELMLDPTMTYSCAYWERPGMTLEEAQRAKIRHICEKLGLGPDDHVLEIGCGWGGFAIQAAADYGCRVTGLTLSPSQASSRASGSPRPGSPTGSRSSSRTTGSSRAVHEDRLDRDVRGDRAGRVRELLRRDRPPARTPTGSPASRRSASPTGGSSATAAARLDPADDLPRLAAAVARGDREGGRRNAAADQRRRGDRLRLRPYAARVARERLARTSTGSASSATTSASCGSGRSTSPIARRASRSARCATCRSC